MGPKATNTCQDDQLWATVGNARPRQHQPHIIAEPNSITRENFGDFQATAGNTSPTTAKTPSTKRTTLDQKTKYAK